MRGCRFAISVWLLCLVQLVNAEEAALDLELREFQRFEGLYEPSGVVQLQDGRLLVIEDEPSRAFVLISPQVHATDFDVEVLQARTSIAALLTGRASRFSDLEGLVQGPGGFIYAITSHSRQGNGKRSAEREKLLRLNIDGNRIRQIRVRSDLRKRLIEAFPQLEDAAKEQDVKDEGGLNIEGLTFNRKKDTLWIGFRAPLLEDRAMLIGLRNPQSLFDTDEDFQFEENLQLLDLDGGGIRDIVFDQTLNGYLIASQREGTKSEKAFKLWFWDGSPTGLPRRVKIAGVKDLQRTEGISSVLLKGERLLLLLSDDGDVDRQKNAGILLVDYDDLEIE